MDDKKGKKGMALVISVGPKMPKSPTDTATAGKVKKYGSNMKKISSMSPVGLPSVLALKKSEVAMQFAFSVLKAGMGGEEEDLAAQRELMNRISGGPHARRQNRNKQREMGMEPEDDKPSVSEMLDLYENPDEEGPDGQTKPLGIEDTDDPEGRRRAGTPRTYRERGFEKSFPSVTAFLKSL
tara:strand:+ start:1014 stop:1559 length:546 start_codon:yes stop_codon:yes gene_type:complete